MSVPETWSQTLSQAIAQTLTAIRANLADDAVVSMLALDCHPWDGGIYLALLMQSEVVTDPAIAAPEEMASWELYDCAHSLIEWKPVEELATQMRQDYLQASEPATMADDYFQACARALQAPQVGSVLEAFRLDKQFRLSVAHPDDGREFCS